MQSLPQRGPGAPDFGRIRGRGVAYPQGARRLGDDGHDQRCRDAHVGQILGVAAGDAAQLRPDQSPTRIKLFSETQEDP
eukprot:1051404-Pyramimonas_sp.AAC.1